LQTETNLYRSVRIESFPAGTIINDKPAPEILHPDFEPRILPSGKQRKADVKLSEDKQWVYAKEGTSLFDKKNVFKSKSWLSFDIPVGTLIPESLVVRLTGYNPVFEADHYQIESRAERMRVDTCKAALDNLARNAVVRSIALSNEKHASR
jgi:hypothetical protein